MTNLEKIKTMNSEELANIMKYPCRICIYHNNGCGLYSSCKEGIKGWLESEEQR